MKVIPNIMIIIFKDLITWLKVKSEVKVTVSSVTLFSVISLHIVSKLEAKSAHNVYKWFFLEIPGKFELDS